MSGGRIIAAKAYIANRTRTIDQHTGGRHRMAVFLRSNVVKKERLSRIRFQTASICVCACVSCVRGYPFSSLQSRYVIIGEKLTISKHGFGVTKPTNRHEASTLVENQ